MKIKTTFLLLAFLGTATLFAQEKTEVLLLGTYHFGGMTSDEVKVTGDDILSDKKQKELEVVLGKLKKFNPEKIYVEDEPTNQKFWDSIYIAYKNGDDIKLKNEIFQIGIKLASKSKLENGVTCADWQRRPARTFAEKEYIKHLEKMLDYYKTNDIPDKEARSKYEKQVSKEIRSFNHRIPSLPLIEVFRKLNSDRFLNKMFYGNISGMLDIDEHNMNIFWSQNNMIRNLNIYQNIIQDILKSKPKRVLVLYGSGHIKALENYFEVHPAIKIVETENILK